MSGKQSEEASGVTVLPAELHSVQVGATVETTSDPQESRFSELMCMAACILVCFQTVFCDW